MLPNFFADYLTEFGGYAHEDFIIDTPVVTAEEAARLQVPQHPNTLERFTGTQFFLVSFLRLSQWEDDTTVG